MLYKTIISITLISMLSGIKILSFPLDYFLISSFIFIFIFSLSIPRPQTGFFLSLSVFILLINLSVIVSDDVKESLLYSIRFIPFLLLYMAVSGVKKEKDLEFIMRVLIYSYTLICFLAIYQLYAGTHIYYGRFYTPGLSEKGDPNFTAYNLIVLFVFSIHLASKEKKMYLFSLFFLILTLATFSRGVLLSLALTFIIFKKNKVFLIGKKQISYFFLILIFISPLLALIILQIDSSYINSTFRLDTLKDGSGRLDIYITILENFKTVFWTGIGAGQYKTVFPHVSSNGHLVNLATHNSYLEVFISGGVFILLSFVFLLYYSVFYKIKPIDFLKNKTANTFFILGVFSIFSMLFINLETSRMLWFVLFALVTIKSKIITKNMSLRNE